MKCSNLNRDIHVPWDRGSYPRWGQFGHIHVVKTLNFKKISLLPYIFEKN